MNIRAEIFGGAQRPLLKEKQPRKSAKGLGDVEIVREEARRANGRGNDRYRLSGAVFKVTYHGHDYDAEVINLSGGGAMIAADLLPNHGERLHLHLGENGAMECVVRWIKGGRLGLEFAHETQLDCADDDQAALLRDVIHRAFPDEKFGSEPAKAVSGGNSNIRNSHDDGNDSTSVDDGPDQREAIRHPLIWSGELHHGSHCWRVRLRNISATGALIECNGQLRTDSEVVLDLDKAGALTASVSWIVGDHVGLKFEEPFDLRLLAQSKPQVTPPRWLRPAYLEAETEADSPWDRNWGRVSMDELRSKLEGFLKR